MDNPEPAEVDTEPEQLPQEDPLPLSSLPEEVIIEDSSSGLKITLKSQSFPATHLLDLVLKARQEILSKKVRRGVDYV